MKWDLTPLDILWDFLKEKVFANNAQTILEIRTEIRRVIDKIQPQLW